MIVEVVCVRHGQTYWNAEKRLQGQLDTDLSELGREQADVTGKHLREKLFPSGFDHVVSSDLKRAYETALAIVRDEKIITKESRLREMNLGIFQGKTAKECARDASEAWKQFRNDPHFVIPNGESHMDKLRRVGEALDEVARLSLAKSGKKDGEKVRLLLVAHGGVMDSIYRHANRIGMSDAAIPHTGNCSVSILHGSLVKENEFEWRTTVWNDLSHLAQKTESKMF